MAVDVDLLNSNSLNNIETNFERVQTALQDAVSRSGNIPNQMTADLDMNSNDLLNVASIDTEVLYINGEPVVPDTLGSIPANSVGTSQIIDESITNTKLADNSVTNTKIADNSITLAKMADNSVGTSEIVDSSVTESKLNNNSVSEPKLTRRLSARVGSIVNTVPELLADTTLTYSNMTAGDYITASECQYIVAASGASDHHLTTSGGLKLYVQKDAQGRYPVIAWGAVGDGVTDDAPAIQLAINSLTSAGAVDLGARIMFPAGTFLLGSEIQLKHGIEIEGVNFHSPGSATAATLFLGAHDGNSVVSFVGAQGCAMRDIGINVKSGNQPKTHILMGRNNSGSAGLHVLERVFATGVASVASLYTIASEQNTYRDCYFELASGSSGRLAFFSSTQDLYSVAGLTTSSNVHHNFYSCTFNNQVDASDSKGIYLRLSGSSGIFTFAGCYQHQARGDYVYLNSGSDDGNRCIGGVSFLNHCGEIYELGAGTNSPVNGYNIFGVVAMRGLVISGGRMAQRAGVTPQTLTSTVAFEDCIIDLPQNRDDTISSGSLIGSTIPSLTRSTVNHDRFYIGNKEIRSSVTPTTTTAHVYFINGNGVVGNISTNSTVTAYNTSSDETWKDFIGPYDPTKAIAIIKADPVRDFHWDEDHGGDYAIGWGAQTSYSVSPDLASPGGWFDPSNDERVPEGTDGAEYRPWSVDQSKRTPYLWAAVSYLIDQNEKLVARIEELERKNNEIG